MVHILPTLQNNSQVRSFQTKLESGNWMSRRELRTILRNLECYDTSTLRITAMNLLIRPIIRNRAKAILRQRLGTQRLHLRRHQRRRREYGRTTKGRRWTQEEIAFIRENYEKKTALEIGKEIGRTCGSIWRFVQLNRRKLGLLRKGSWGPNRQFDKTPQPALAYILGVLYGDGYVRLAHKSFIRLAVKDKEFVESFKSAVGKIGLHPSRIRLNLWHTKHKGTSPQYLVEAYSKPFCKWFKSLTFDEVYRLLQTPEMKREFIRGFYESEGCLSTGKNYRGMKIVNTNLELINLAQHILNDLGFYPHKYCRNPQPPSIKQLYSLALYKQKSIKRFLNEIGPCIPRKSLMTPKILLSPIT